MTIGRWGRALLVPLSAVVLSAVPATAQVKVRFQTWHWNENPWVKALEEFQKGFNAASPGIQVQPRSPAPPGRRASRKRPGTTRSPRVRT